MISKDGSKLKVAPRHPLFRLTRLSGILSVLKVLSVVRPFLIVEIMSICLLQGKVTAMFD